MSRLHSVRFPLLLILLCIVLISIFNTPYRTTRYSFFFFPLIFIIAHIEFVALGNLFGKFFKKKSIKIICKCLIFIPFIMYSFTEDFNLHHILNVSSKEANFRLGKYEKLANHWFHRIDYESPALFVNSAYKDGDVILLETTTSSFYLHKPFINFIDINRDRFKEQSRKSGKEELWTGLPLIYNPSQLLYLVPNDPQRSLFVITIKSKRSNAKYLYNLINENIFNETGFSKKVEYVGLDGRTEVWKINRSI